MFVISREVQDDSWYCCEATGLVSYLVKLIDKEAVVRRHVDQMRSRMTGDQEGERDRNRTQNSEEPENSVDEGETQEIEVSSQEETGRQSRQTRLRRHNRLYNYDDWDTG